MRRPRPRLPWPGAVALVSALFFLDPRELLPGFLAAVAVHELGHLAVLAWLSPGRVRFGLRAGGALLETGLLGWRQEALCALAGPAAGFVFAGLAFPRFPVAAAMSSLLSRWNLLPVEPLDGGRALAALTLGLLPGAGLGWLRRGEQVFLLLFALRGAYHTLCLHAGPLPLLLAAALALARAGQ